MLDVLQDYGSTFATSKQYQQFGLHQTQRKQPDAIIEDVVPLGDKEQPRYNRHPNLSILFSFCVEVNEAGFAILNETCRVVMWL